MIIRKNRLLLLISILLVISFLVTSLASYYVSRSSLRSEITENQLPLTSDNLYSEIQRDLLTPILISSLMANDTLLRDWILTGEKQPEQITKYLNEIKNKYNAFTSFFISEKTKIYYHANGVLKTVREEEARDKWYFRVAKMKSDFEINVDIDMANADALTIFINYKVFDYQGRYIGATGVGLNVYAVKKMIETYQDRYQSNIFFMNKQGEITLQDSVNSLPSSNISKMARLNEHFQNIINSQKSIFKYDHMGATYHVNTRYIPELKWYLIVEQAEDKAIRSIWNTLVINLLISSATTLIVLILIYLLVSAYQKRLERMAFADKLTNARLQSEIIEREKVEAQIKASLEEKKTLLKEIHHRVKNNMSVISSLLELQMAHVTDKKANEALQDSQNRVTTMSMIHETLYRSDNLSTINMQSYLSELGRTVLHGYSTSDINLKIEAENIMIGSGQASSLGFIINELITNSLKYAFPDRGSGEIVLKLKLDNKNEVELTVSDNGVGLPEGINLNNTESLGLQLTKTIAEHQLNGSINVDSENGAKFTIKFNINKA